MAAEISSFKVVGLIASVVTILACFVGAVTWVSINMAGHSVSIESLRVISLRHENLIVKNTAIIGQHAQLLAILKQQGAAIDTLNNFMTEGGRFTERDGARLRDELQIIKDRLQHYEILETELSWIKASIARIEASITKRFDSLHDKLNVSKKETRR
jgi:hypothetical protein